MAVNDKSIFAGQAGAGVSDANKRAAAAAEADARRSLRTTSQIPVNQLEEDYVPLSDGTFIKINPKKIAEQTQYAINMALSKPAFNFLRPYLNKPVIWTYEAKSAFTDGIRIFMNPLFAMQMLKISSKAAQGYVDAQREKNPLYIENKKDTNFRAGKLVIFVIVHECYHVLYQHVKRERLLIGKDPEKHPIANIAADLEINRDIESCFADLAGSTNEIGGVWWENAEWQFEDGTKVGLKKGEKSFKRDVFEDILRWMLDNNVKAPESARESPFNDPNNGNAGDDKSHSQYGKGWKQAVKAIQAQEINPADADFI